MSKYIFTHKTKPITITIEADNEEQAKEELYDFTSDNIYEDDFEVEEYDERGARRTIKI